MNSMIMNPMFVTIIRNTSRVTYNPIYDPPVCCICLDTVQCDKHQCLECGHFTHVACIKKWKKKSKNKSCPTCRTKIKLKT